MNEYENPWFIHSKRNELAEKMMQDFKIASDFFKSQLPPNE